MGMYRVVQMLPYNNGEANGKPNNKTKLDMEVYRHTEIQRDT